jgi:aminoglycoside phosphotransferase (APT) family kinase protein
MADPDVPGVGDIPGLARWLAASGVPGADGIPSVTMIAGGRSNLTYRLDFGGDGEAASSLVLRRPPLGHVLPTAHDMSREYTVLTALSGSAVPVPRPLELCQDTGIIGAPFYVMEYVPGEVLRTRQDSGRLSPSQAGAISQRFVEMLAEIHGLDVRGAGLAEFGRPAGYLARQLSRWQRQWELSTSREMPGYRELVARLTERFPAEAAGPEQGGAGVLVHGDFRLDNMLIVTSGEPRIAAVVDWEMSTLGDPLADLGLTLVYWTEPGEESMPAFSAAASATTAPGFLRRDQLVAAYAGLTGRDLTRLGYYTAFGCFKLAVVMEGIHARFLQGKTVGEGFEREGAAVGALIDRAHRMLDDDE